MENLAIASAIGIDQVGKGTDRRVLYSVLIVKPGSTSGEGAGESGGGVGGKVPGWINFGQGNSVEDAERNLSTTTSKKLFLGHSRAVILGEQTAKDGIGDIVDYLERNKNIRLRNWVLVTKGEAIGIFGAQPELESLFAEEVNNLLTFSAPRVSKSFAVDLKNFLVDLVTPGKEAVLPLLEVREIPSTIDLESQGGDNKSEPAKNVRLKGMAVFKGEKMVGELEDTETKGFLWVIGKTGGGTLTFQAQNTGIKKPVQVTIEMTRAKSKIEAEILQGKPVITVKIDAEGNLQEFSQSEATLKPEDVAEIDKGYRMEIKKQAMKAILKCQKELQSDIFGFGAALHRQQVKYWKEHELEKNWAQVFPEVQVKVEVRARIRRSGLISDSITVE